MLSLRIAWNPKNAVCLKSPHQSPIIKSFSLLPRLVGTSSRLRLGRALHSGNVCHPLHSVSASPIASALDRAASLLPNQGILENFVHHNPLHNLEEMRFDDALERARWMQMCMSPAERAFSIAGVDPRKRAHEAVVHLSSSFLDIGAARWRPRFVDRGFLYFFASLERLGRPAWRRHARTISRTVLRDADAGGDCSSTALAESIIEENLKYFGVPHDQWDDVVLSMLYELRGWSGMFYRMETHPLEAPSKTLVRLADFAAVQSILVRSSMMAVAQDDGWDVAEASFASWLSKAATLRSERIHASVQDASAIAHADQEMERRSLLEREIERDVLLAINRSVSSPMVSRPTLQLFTCIDDRECSLRRHVEEICPQTETFGIAGFFGLPIRVCPSDGHSAIVLAPEGVTPIATVIERESHPGDTGRQRRRVVFVARLKRAWDNASLSPLASLALACFVPFTMARLLLLGFAPTIHHKVSQLVRNVVIPMVRTTYDLPMSVESAAAYLAPVLKSTGAHHRFAPVVIVLGHGASSVNNPFFAAYNCGGCAGRGGGRNAQLFARFANDVSFRDCLLRDHGISIPNDTVFIGAHHNTTADSLHFFDTECISDSQRPLFLHAQRVLEEACGVNALERCQRFLLANVHTPNEALRCVFRRSIDAAEIRPELNHATNAAMVVARRELTKGVNFNRRVFLQSYDPHSDDDAGTNLELILGPALVISSGINLEYLFSTIDIDHYGIGTKIPLNVVGNIGLQQGTAGDLRPGLPSQMTEMHVPVRLMFMVDAPVDRMTTLLDRRKDLSLLVRNEWVRFFVRDPASGEFFRQSMGKFIRIDEDYMNALRDFKLQHDHLISVVQREKMVYRTTMAGLVASYVIPVYLYGPHAMNEYGSLVALVATGLTLPVLGFSRRYMHGDFMFTRISMLSVGLLLGFNLVATSPSLVHSLAGWGLLGFSSTFLIGAYNDRPSVRNNATFAFAAYRISDFALLTAATFSGAAAIAGGYENNAVVAGGLLLAALYKSSQFPLTALFVRSMEGPTPTSALGYAGLSAHVGVVLLAGTMPLWYPFDMARLVLASVGLTSAFHGALVSKIRSDRKGALAYATSSTVGVIFTSLAMGYSELALVLSLGHAAFRMNQVLLCPNSVADSQDLNSILGVHKPVPDWLYKVSWTLRRIDEDMHFLHALQRVSGAILYPEQWRLTKAQQWVLTGAGVIVAGIPFTPVSHELEMVIMSLLPTHPLVAAGVMLGHFGVSVAVMRVLFVKVLSRNRFRRTHAKATQTKTKS